MTDPETNSIEEAAGEKFGVQRWDRPAIFRESADAATDNGLPYWMILILSGGIATLGLAINSAAVVIGAMLVAPLLAPVVGLALSLAVGDGRLAVQTGAVVAGSTLAVVLMGALLTMLLPFQTVTLEILARARPTTLDLAIAVFSGLVGAVVTVARGSRLSAAIPGVAISVALIPPLAVAGFGIGSGWNADLIRGSMLLYGANLAGIVLSGMAVFLLVGMHRADVVEAARRWHREEAPQGLAAWADRLRWVRALGVFHTPAARVGLVAAFAVALGIPLTGTLGQIAREARVEQAVSQAADEVFGDRERASLLSRQVVYGPGGSQVYLRVATTRWFDAEARLEFERSASALAEEPVRLSLEQLPSRGEDMDDLAQLLPGQRNAAAQVQASPPASVTDLVGTLRLRLQETSQALQLPAEVAVVGLDLAASMDSTPVLHLAYAGRDTLHAQAAEMLHLQLAALLALPDLEVRMTHVSTQARGLTGLPGDTMVLRGMVDVLSARPGVAAEVIAPPGREGDGEAAVAWLAAQGVASSRVRVSAAAGDGVRVRLVPRMRN